MIDAIGLGGFLVNFAIFCATIFFIVGFVFLKLVLRKNILWSVGVGVILGIAGFFLSPNLFLLYLKIIDISF